MSTERPAGKLENFSGENGKTCITNIWIPDGEKENPYNSIEPRQRLMESLDEILSEKIDPSLNKDAVESKLLNRQRIICGGIS